MQAIFTAATFWTSLKWCVVALLWGGLTWDVFRKHRSVRQMLHNTAHPAPFGALMRVLYQRTIQLWIMVTLLMLSDGANDIRYQKLQELANERPAAEDTVAASPVRITGSSVQAGIPSAASGTSSSLPFMDITEFNEKDSKEQAWIDALKERYEAWLVTFYYLQKCGQADAQDFTLIRNDMQKALDNAHADTRVGSNVLLAASGSYNEMYRDIACDSQHLATSKTTYDVNMQQLRAGQGQIPVQNKDH